MQHFLFVLAEAFMLMSILEKSIIKTKPIYKIIAMKREVMKIFIQTKNIFIRTYIIYW